MYCYVISVRVQRKLVYFVKNLMCKCFKVCVCVCARDLLNIYMYMYF